MKSLFGDNRLGNRNVTGIFNRLMVVTFAFRNRSCRYTASYRFLNKQEKY